jgi:hypothetical protein
MPRQRSTQPRDEQLLIRLTARQLRVLQSVAHLESAKSPNAYAHRLLVDHLESMEKNRRVQADLKNRDAYDADAKKATPLRGQHSAFAAEEVRDAKPSQRRAPGPQS